MHLFASFGSVALAWLLFAQFPLVDAAVCVRTEMRRRTAI